MEIGQVNYDLDAIRQHAEWISKQQVERLRDEDLIFAIEWFDYNQKFVMEQKRRGIIRKVYRVCHNEWIRLSPVGED